MPKARGPASQFSGAACEKVYVAPLVRASTGDGVAPHSSIVHAVAASSVTWNVFVLRDVDGETRQRRVDGVAGAPS